MACGFLPWENGISDTRPRAGELREATIVLQIYQDEV